MSIWKMEAGDPALPLLERIMALRGIVDAEAFLAPSFETGIHPPEGLHGMEKAVARIKRSMDEGETIAIAGDYDADGVCAAAFLHHFFRVFGKAKAVAILPHRVRDGFGLNRRSVERARAEGASLIVTVDNGITAADAVDYAVSLGIEVIITDHHSDTGILPEAALAIIDPALEDQEYPFAALSGAGVAYKLADAILRSIVADGVIEDAAREHFLKWHLDLVALATVADVVDLVDENRVLVFFGLQVMNNTRNKGIACLRKISKTETVNAEAVAFRFGPRINAAGRLDDPQLAFELLTEEDDGEVLRLAEKLEQLNQQRQGLVRRAVADAEKIAEKQIKEGERILIVENGAWHPGIIGLISGRLSERHNHPVVAFTRSEEDDGWVASCRSVVGFDLREMLIRFSSFFVKSGGHALAAGLTVPNEKMALFREALFSYAREVLGDAELQSELLIDAHALPEDISIDTCLMLERMAPFGQGNREPIIRFDGITLLESRRVGGEGAHFRFTFRGVAGVVAGIGFGMGDFADSFPSRSVVDLVAHLRINEFRGVRAPQLILKDMRLPETV